MSTTKNDVIFDADRLQPGMVVRVTEKDKSHETSVTVGQVLDCTDIKLELAVVDYRNEVGSKYVFISEIRSGKTEVEFH